MSLAVIAAAIAGLGASLLARYAATYCQRAFGRRDLLPQIAGDLRRLAAGTDTHAFVGEYLQLLRRLTQLAALQLVMLLASLVTLTAIYAATCRLLDSVAQSQSVYITVKPACPIAVQDARGVQLEPTAQKLFPTTASSTAITILVDGHAMATFSPALKQAYARSPFAQAGLVCLGFRALAIDSAQFPGIAACVSRPMGQAFNPLWPWLSDVECSFLVTAVIGSAIAPFVVRSPA